MYYVLNVFYYYTPIILFLEIIIYKHLNVQQKICSTGNKNNCKIRGASFTQQSAKAGATLVVVPLYTS